MAREYDRIVLNPLECLKMLGIKEEYTKHISYNPNLKHGVDHAYWIIRQVSYDGTLIFQRDLIYRAFKNVIDGVSVNKLQEIPENADAIRYEIGNVKLATVFGKVDLPCGNYPGQKDRIRMIIKAIPYKKETN